jgi:hypothetical protein
MHRSVESISLRGGEYDGRRLLNTPLSLEACRLEGVLPELLLVTNSRDADNIKPNSFTALLPVSPEQSEAKRGFMERKRQALVNTAQLSYQSLIAAASRGRSPPKTARQKSTGQVATPPPLPRQRKAPRPHLAFHDISLPEDNTEVAQFFTQLQSEANNTTTRLQKWDKHKSAVDNRLTAFTARRAADCEDRSVAIDQRVNTVRHRRDGDKTRRHDELANLLDRKTQRSLNFTLDRSKKQKETLQRGAGHGDKERAAAVQLEGKRVEVMKEKLEKAKNASMETTMRTQKEQQQRLFMSDLQNAASKEMTLRASRATAHRTEELAFRIEAATRKRDAAADGRANRMHEKALQRELVQRQKRDLQLYVAECVANNQRVEAPAWLSDQLAVLDAKKKVGSPQQSPERRNERTPRRPEMSPEKRVNTASTFAVREKFTISSSQAPSGKQAFAPWMYQSS